MTFEVGDRVRCTKDYERDPDTQGSMVGLIGTVRAANGYEVGVEFDDDFECGHVLYSGGQRNAEEGHGWWLLESCLELVTEAKAARSPGSIGEFFKKQEALYAVRDR